MKVIIAGSRDITDYNVVKEAMNGFMNKLAPSCQDSDAIIINLDFFSSITEVVSGTARGADRLGEEWANDRCIPIKRMPANWAHHGKSAGYIRNSEMAMYADALVALWDNKSRGTGHMIDLAYKYDIPVFIHKV
tara:strand:+ start:319 stop:720 length:402 start_codon:yes stop_codon:yes gene_type:complete